MKPKMFNVCAVLVLSALCSQAGPRVCCDAPEYDFGALDAGSVARHAFEIRNRGDAPLKLSVAVACCGAKAALARSEVEPGGMTVVTVELALRNGSNTVDKVVFLGTSDKATPYLKLRLKGRVAAPTAGLGEKTANVVAESQTVSEMARALSRDKSFGSGICIEEGSGATPSEIERGWRDD